MRREPRETVTFGWPSQPDAAAMAAVAQERSRSHCKSRRRSGLQGGPIEGSPAMVCKGMAETPTTSPQNAVEPQDPESKDLDLGGAVASGIKWKLASQLVSEGSRVVVTVILA